MKQLKGKDLGDYLLLNYSMLKDDADLFLDDTSLKEVKKALGIKIKITNGTGEDFIDKIIK